MFFEASKLENQPFNFRFFVFSFSRLFNSRFETVKILHPLANSVVLSYQIEYRISMQLHSVKSFHRSKTRFWIVSFILSIDGAKRLTRKLVLCLDNNRLSHEGDQ